MSVLKRLCLYQVFVFGMVCFFALCGTGCYEQQMAVEATLLHKPQSPVVDYTNTLSADETAELESIAYALRDDTGAQLQVVLVQSTLPQDIESYSLALFEHWQLGRKGVDDGLLLLVAKDDRRVRVEVGYGLEGVVPDVVAARVIEAYITPYFKRGKYFEGIEAGMTALSAAARQEALPPPAEQGVTQADDVPSWSNLDWAVGFSMVFAFAMGWLGQRIRKGWILFGLSAALVPVLIGLFVVKPPLFALFFLMVAIPLALVGVFYSRVRLVRVYFWIALVLLCVAQGVFHWYEGRLMGLVPLGAGLFCVGFVWMLVSIFFGALYSGLMECWKQSALGLLVRLLLWAVVVGWLVLWLIPEIDLWDKLVSQQYDELIGVANILFCLGALVVLLVILSFGHASVGGSSAGTTGSNGSRRDSDDWSGSSSSSSSSWGSSDSDDSDSGWYDSGGSAGGGGATGSW